ncbi:acetyl-CoA carboxylase carboxyltransferase subunit alpha [Vagococcus vulneris]|uniref:acetyl-CoA carboxytransferase n=1 Tax=Vagococcus vulneris TaxID=1977869 RepID=A0A429ZZ78_9ENTE|nr:acetyl-CoA carboxylase carboxyltransferase subunit alpha [Vagococcus vulneris]RST99286.1 acetyl-CoA carboxylase carboxyl transferase subunit alpha [Vagococcus vulneris]
MTTNKRSASEVVALARAADRLTARDYINFLCDTFVECHGDRYFGDDQAIVGGIGKIDNIPITIIGIQKGRDLQENLTTHFGSPTPEGYRKALRLMKQAEKFKRPIITFINTPGAFCGIEAEERGEGEAIAKNLYEMSHLNVPILAVITGEGGSGGALALAVGNQVWMMEHSIYSILSPEGFASILWKDSSRAKEAAEIMKLTADDLFELSIIDKVIEETKNGKTLPNDIILSSLKKMLLHELASLSSLSEEELVLQRMARFRKF